MKKKTKGKKKNKPHCKATGIVCFLFLRIRRLASHTSVRHAKEEFTMSCCSLA